MVFDPILNLADLDGNNGFVFTGINDNDQLGPATSAGDVNGDGFGDLIIGASGADPNNNQAAGETYIVFGTGTFGASFDLSTLNGTNGFVITGIRSGDLSGGAVGGAGDVNGDGFDDVVIGASNASIGDVFNVGESYVVFGGSSFGASLSLATLNGDNGFTINGVDPVGFSGSSVSGAGDVNGDGFSDVIISATSADSNGLNDTGETYIVFGGSGLGASVDLASLDGSNGFVVSGVGANALLGISISTAGDVNGDGFSDVIIGARSNDPNDVAITGASYVVFGGDNFGASLDLSTLDGSNGFVMTGINLFDGLGESVSNAGDVNGDGIDDLIIGAPNVNAGIGASYVVFGRTDFGASVDLSSLDGSNGFVLNGSNGFHLTGFSVSGAGDVNGDGIGDLIVSAPLVDANGNLNAGESYVVFGRTSFEASINLAALNGSDGFAIRGIDPLDESGSYVSRAGDVNGDGVDDLLVGTFVASPDGNVNTGESYVIFGRRANQSPQLLPTATFSINENTTLVFDFTASDDSDSEGSGLTYSITGGADEGSLIIDPNTGVLSFVNAPNFENPADEDANNTYEVEISVTDSEGNADNLLLNINVVDVNENQSPTITTDAILAATENITLVVDVNAIDDSDSDGNGLLYAISGGADGTLFNISSIGELSFKVAPVFANPQDGNDDNIYNVEVTVFDSEGRRASRLFSVSVLEAPPLVDGETATIFVNSANIVVGNTFQVGQPYNGELFGNTDGTFNPNDVVQGTEGDDNIWMGLEGDDLIDAGGGNDTIALSDGNTTVFAGDGDDFVYAAGAGTGTHTIDLGAGNNSFWAIAGNHIITGTGNNTIAVGTGNDTVTLGDGDDFVYSSNGGGGTDVLNLGDGTNTVWVEGGDYAITTGSGNDSIGLGTGTDTVNAGDGNNIIYMVNSALPAGSKTVFTGAGNDYIETGSGDDLLGGGAGLNTLRGGAGSDTFVVRSDAYNYMGDFAVGSDRIQLSGLTLSDLSFSQGTGSTAADTFIFQGSNLLMQVANTNVNALNNATNFI